MTEQRKSKRLSRGVTFQLAQNDDRAERQRRRLSSNLLAKAPSFVSEPSLDEAELEQIQLKTLELLAGNKINQKNSWDLQFIEHMNEFITPSPQTSLTNFQKASCTLDASVKIYSYRVDSVHNQTFKILGGLHRTQAEEEHGPESTECNSDEELVKPRSSKNPKKSTLVNSASIINAKDSENKEGMARIDPSLFLFGENLWLDSFGAHDGCRISIEFSPEGSSVSQDPDVDLKNIMLEPSGFKNKLIKNLDQILNSPICPEISELHSRIESARLGNKNGINNESGVGEGFISEDEVENEEIAFADVNDELHWDDEYLDVEDRGEHFETTNLPSGEDHGSLMDPLLELFDDGIDDWHNLDKLPILQTAAHWKFNVLSLKKKKTEFSKVGSNRVRSKSSRKPKVIDFYSEIDSSEIEEKLQIGKSSNKLTKNALLKMARERSDLLLPPTEIIDRTRYVDRFLMKGKFGFNRRNKSQESSRIDQEMHAPTNFYSDDNDGFDDMIVNDDELISDSKHDQMMTSDADFAVSLSQNISQGELEMVAEPWRVKKAEIKFAKSATKVDVRALKQRLWHTIAEPLHLLESSETHHQESQSGQDDQVSFQKVVQEVNDGIPENSSGSASIPFCFVCLLHLANEHNLQLGSPANSDSSACSMDDIIIQRSFDNLTIS